MMRQVQMLDLKAEFDLFADEVRSVVHTVLQSQQFIGGPAIAELEEAIAELVGVRHAMAVSNGSDALLCALMAIGVGVGDEVIVPSFTFFATAGSVSRTGATPVFVDVDERTFNLDPAALRKAITGKTKAVIPVHAFGQCADMDAINDVAAERGLIVLEDAAQALGASYGDRHAGALGKMACFSFYPTKNLGGFGEGGMIVTDDDELAQIVRQLRNHGESKRYYHDRIGGNFRLDTMKAALLLVKLKYFERFTKQRRANAARYGELLSGAPVTLPYVADGHLPVYHQYTIQCDRRGELQSFLRDRGVASGIYYPVPLHLQKCFASLGYRPGDLPLTERLCDRVLSLPCHPLLSDEDLEFVSSRIHEFYVSCETAATGGTTEDAVR